MTPQRRVNVAYPRVLTRALAHDVLIEQYEAENADCQQADEPEEQHSAPVVGTAVAAVKVFQESDIEPTKGAALRAIDNLPLVE